MAKPIATAVVDGAAYGHRGVTEVQITRSRKPGCVATFYAPGWRSMAFRTVEAAKAKIATHPGFQSWAV